MAHLKENKIPIIILAGGKSSRFTKDKARLKLGDKSLTFHQYKKFQKLFKKVYISSKKNKFDFDPPIIFDKQKEYLPIFTLINLIQKFHTIFIVPVDVPLLKPKTIQKLLKQKTISDNSPFIGVYTYKDLKKLKENIKLGKYSPRIGKKTTKTTDLEVLNINYKIEFLKYRFDIKKGVVWKNNT